MQKTEKMERHFEQVREAQELKLAIKLAGTKEKAVAHEYKMALQMLRTGLKKGTLLSIDAVAMINKVLEENN